MTIAFLIAALVVVVTPGAGVLYTVATGMGWGRRAGLVAAVGCTLGVVPHLAVALVAVAALLHTAAPAFQALRYAGAAYLVWLGWTTLRDRGAADPDATRPAPSARQVVTGAVLTNLLNPKLTIFLVAFLPQFVGADDPHRLVRMLGLGSVLMVLTLVVYAGYGVLAGTVRDHVLGRPWVSTWLRRGFAGSFLAMGAALALTR
ncbi:LysE family translocator [Micromonospora sp. NPDC002296]|uniref:LysE family translocator n=1 Tax=Micromonospora sp. NPDC002296 TaxID=3154271 RepID=UPI00332C16D1